MVLVLLSSIVDFYQQQELQKNFSKYSNIKILNKDGFNLFNERKINQNKKGIILIDPSYEIKDDYGKIIDFINDNYNQFLGCFLP